MLSRNWKMGTGNRKQKTGDIQNKQGVKGTNWETGKRSKSSITISGTTDTAVPLILYILYIMGPCGVNGKAAHARYSRDRYLRPNTQILLQFMK